MEKFIFCAVKSTNSNTRSLRMSFKLQIISTRTLELYNNPLKQLFIQLYLWKNMNSSSFYQMVVAFFVNLLTETLWIYCQNILCFLGMQTKFLFFSCIRFSSWKNSTNLSSKLSLTYGGNVKACECYFYQVFIFSSNDSPSETMKNVFYFI